MSAAESSEQEHETETRALLAHLGTAMIATGQPVHEVEEDLAEVGVHFGYPDIQIAAGPTGLMLSLTDGGPSTVRSARESLRLDQSASVRHGAAARLGQHRHRSGRSRRGAGPGAAG